MSKIPGVEFIAMNTDAEHLAITEAVIRIQLGKRSLILRSDGLREMVRNNVVDDIVLRVDNA